MTNLNIFRRLNELETANLHLQVMLKSARAEIETIKNIVYHQTKQIASLQTEAMPVPAAKAAKAVKVTATPKPKQTQAQKRAKLNKYQRTYYAKKKAERAAKEAV